MKRKYIILILIVAVLGTWGSCKSDFLTVAPTGSLDQTLLQTTKGLDALLIGAYSMIDGTSSQFGNGWETTASNWVFGSIRGMEANKGTDGGDQPDINPIQTFSETATNPFLNLKWREVYEAISRCNSLIIITNKALAANKITQAQADLYNKQAKVLRGWYHFEAWRMWVKVPYIDETVVDPGSAPNTADIGPQILADLSAGLDLPNNMGAIGKFNGTVVKILTAKAMMQISHDYAAALPLLLDAKNNGTKPNGAAFSLAPTYGEIFDIANRNGPESIYTVQYSVNDGSGAWNSSVGEVLNFPYKSGGSPGGCCGFFDPTQEFVNSFRTLGGLPQLDNGYNLNPIKNDQGVALTAAYTPDANPVDPRLDWTVGRRGIPYWDWGLHTGSDWIRDQTYSGPFSPKKAVYKKSQTEQYTDHSSWTSGYTANGYRMIRYADLLLLIAECQIEIATPDLAAARANINLVRGRAANVAGFVKMPDATNAGNYVINQYPASGYPFDTKANAQLALRMERKLELGMEGQRWFDLNRWGTTVAELTRILTYEKSMPWGSNLYGANTVGATAVKYPIPQRQIDLSNGKLTQN